MSQSSEKPLLPVYLAVGNDALKRRHLLERMKARISSHGDLSFNSDEFDGHTALGSDIVVSCNTMPFASDVRLVVVSGVEFLKKSDAEELISYLENPNQTTVLFLEAEKLLKNTRLYKAIAATNPQAVIDCSLPKAAALPDRVRNMAPEHGATMTPEAARALVELVGEDMIRIDTELRKIALAHRGADPINENEVYSMVARTSEIKPWELVNAFSARDLKKCLLYLSRMKSTSPIGLLSMCVTRVRELIATRAMVQRGTRSQLMAVLKKNQEWQIKNHYTWARGFSDEELRRALSTARDAERAMKSGSDPHEVFVSWLAETLPRTTHQLRHYID